MPAPRRPDTAFWVEPEAIAGDRLELSPEESHHLLDVFRAHAGAPFVAVDGAGLTYECVLESSADGVAVGRIVSREEGKGELPVAISVLAGLPDLAAAETIVAHAVPLGATRIDLVPCARSGRGALGPARLDRLSRIARSATKQSLRSRLAVVRSPASLEAALSDLDLGPRLLADVGGGSIADLESQRHPKAPVVVATGPPGGFDAREVDLLRGAGFTPISLGPSRLTTEIAAIALLVVARNTLLQKELRRI